MDFKKKLQNFWRLNAQSAKGFTLVELIVVIAILAILAGIAVPAYSGYVEKANKQADQTLVSEVSNALTLGYYTDTANATSDFVVLTTEGAQAGNSFAEAAMLATFGEGWESNCALKYDGWVSANNIDTLLDSSYLSNNHTTADLLSSVSSLTNIAAGAFTDANSLVEFLGVDDALIDELEAYGFEVGTEEYNNAATNLLVLYVADELANFDPEAPDANMSYAAIMACQYASVYAYKLGTGGDMSDFNAQLEEAAKSGSGRDKAEALLAVLDYANSDEVNAFHDSTDVKDDEAFLELMRTAAAVSGTVLESADISSSDMFQSEGVATVVNNYVKSIEKIKSMNVEEGAIIILCSENGAIDVLPEEANLSN